MMTIESFDSALMQIRLYIDEDAMAHALVQGLRARGVDVTTVIDEGMIERDDNAQLEHAIQERRVIYTFNVGHFCKLHRDYLAQGKSHAGIIVVYRQRYSVGEQIRRLVELAGTKSPEEMRDNLASFDRPYESNYPPSVGFSASLRCNCKNRPSVSGDCRTSSAEVTFSRGKG